MAKITLKGKKDPVYASENLAQALGKLWEDPDVSRDTIVNISPTVKIEIKSIAAIEMGISDDKGGNTDTRQHWIILNDRQDTIYKKSYLTFEEAKADYDFNDLAKYGWTIEERGMTSLLPHLSQPQKEEIERLKAEIGAKWGMTTEFSLKFPSTDHDK